MKDDNAAQKEKNENQMQDYINNITSSPKQSQNDSYTNKLLSPEQTMNQKFFPSKENYFGIKTSPKNTGRPISPVHSPILDYYAGLSPKKDELNTSPKNDYYNNLNLNPNNFSGKLSPNFNYSPSTIFNDQKSNKDVRNSFSNNFTFQNFNNNEEDSKTLQEKMAPFVRKTDANNFIRKSSFPSNNDEKNENQFDEDEDEDNEEAFTLTFDNFDDDLLKDPKLILESDNLQIQKKPSTGMNSSSNIINNNNINNTSEQIGTNLNEKNLIEKQEGEKANNSNSQVDENMVKNIINKKEFKPYIPNKYRNKAQNLNNIKNPVEGQMYSPYENNEMEEYLNFMNNDMENKIPENVEQYINFRSNNIGFENNNKFSLDKNDFSKKQSELDNENLYNNFYYNGDNYKISNFKEYKKKDYLKTGEIPSISAADIVTAITANNKKIKRIDPNTYLNESIEYLSYNIFPLAKDQAGCRFLQERLEKDPITTTEHFYKAIIPYVLPLAKDPFGNYLIQKLFYYLSPEKIKKIMEIISPTILDIGSNSHGTRVIQHLINFLSNKELIDFFLNNIKPFVIPLLKELNGTHIINKFVNEHPECADEINKIIVENCSLLATHRHGCCILQKMIEGSDKKLKESLINNLIDNCFVLIIDQFGNYVMQSILLLNESKFSSAIAMKICDNILYYSKHRYSSNVIEKCFDFCAKKEKKKLIEKIMTPEIISELIMDEHGNYVVQKALYYSDYKEKETILNIIKTLIPKIQTISFGEKLLMRLYSIYPQLNPNSHYEEGIAANDYMDNNYYNKGYKGKGNKNKGKKKKKNNYYGDNEGYDAKDSNNADKFDSNNKIMNNYYNINNNTINININSNPDNMGNNKITLTNNNMVGNNININPLENNNMIDSQANIGKLDNNNDNDNNCEPKKKKKKKKGKKKKKIDEDNNNNINMNVNSNNDEKNVNNDVNCTNNLNTEKNSIDAKNSNNNIQ